MRMSDNRDRYQFVTQSAKNVQLYEKYGTKLREAAEREGISHYCLIRQSVDSIESEITEQAEIL